MKKVSKKLMSVALAAVMVVPVALTAAACKEKNAEGSLRIAYYKGGYGDEWLKTAETKFEESHPGIDVILEGDESDLTCNESVLMQSGKNLPDIFMCGTSNWEQYAEKGEVASLADLYDKTINRDGKEMKFGDYIMPELKNQFYMKTADDKPAEPYVIGWCAQPNGIMYNTTLLAKIEKGVGDTYSGEKWTATPKTYDEFKQYLKDVQRYNTQNNLTGANRIKPFGWSGKSAESMLSMLYVWWAQDQGLTTPVAGREAEGSFYDFWNYGNTSETEQTFNFDGYKQTGIQTAIAKMQDFLFDTSKKGFQEGVTYDNPDIIDNLSQEFAGGKVACMLGSSYFEYENSRFNTQGDSFTLQAIPALNAEVNDAYFMRCWDVMYIPAKAANVELAKEFLLSLSEEEAIDEFTKTTGSIRPFKRNVAENNPDHAWTEFQKSVSKLVYGDGTNKADFVLEFPAHVDSLAKVSTLYYAHKPSVWGGISLATFYDCLKEFDGAKIMTSEEDDGFTSVYEKAMSDKGLYTRLYGLTYNGK